MVMFPMVLLGSLIGVLINTILPDTILLAGLTVILVFLTVKSFMTARKLWKKENKVMNENAIDEQEKENLNQNIESKVQRLYLGNQEIIQKDATDNNEDAKESVDESTNKLSPAEKIGMQF
jgi:predicted membrane protein